HLLALTLAGVGDVKLNLNLPLRLGITRRSLDGQVAIRESRIGQAVSKWKKRLRAVVIEPSVPDVHAFAIPHLFPAGIGVIAVMNRIIIPAAFECDRQPAGWIYVSENKLR